MIVDDECVRARLQDLAEALTASGHLRSPRWREALLAVRRHVFVPLFWRDEDPGAYPARWRMVDNATVDHDEWLAAVYSDCSLPIELLGVPTPDGRGMHPLVTSSTTMPSLVVAMLEALDIDDTTDDVSVLEIGTATGYNAGLLCERLGDHRVTTIDISPELAALAQVRLAAHGYHPHVLAGDGADGVPQRAPFDRIIATCWLDHVYRGGDWGLLVQVQEPEVISRQVYVTDPDPADPEAEPPLGTELATRDGLSWAQIHHDPGPDATRTVTHAGPRRLWDEIEALHRAWATAGRPDRSRWELTVDPAGSRTLRLGRYPSPSPTEPERTAEAVTATG